MKNVMKTFLGVVMLGSVVTVSSAAQFPLRVDIDVSTKRDTKNIGAGSDGEARVEKVQVIVKIRKSGGQPWTKPVSAELYVIGKQIQTGNLAIIDVQKGTGVFSKENDNSFYYKSPFYSLGRTSGNINVGGVYETYLVVVTDDEGNIVATRCGRAIKDKGIAFIRELGPMTMFDRDGNVLGKLEDPGAAFKLAVPAAVDPGDDD